MDTQKSSYVTVDTIHVCYYEAEEQEEEKTNNLEEEMLNYARGKRARVEGGIGSQSKRTRKERDTGKRVQVDGGRDCKQCHHICANEVAVHRQMDLSSACKAFSEVRSIIQEREQKLPQDSNGGTGGSAQGEGALGASESQNPRLTLPSPSPPMPPLVSMLQSQGQHAQVSYEIMM